MMELFVVLLSTLVVSVVNAEQPYYIHHCSKADPELNECLKYSGNRLTEYMRHGIPELGITDIEPVVIDEISIALGGGPDGYRATFKNIEAYGVSNLTITNLRSDIDTYQFQLTLDIPRIKTTSQYESSGVLILVQASGAGDYWGEYEGVRAKIYFKGVPYKAEDGLTYLKTEQVKMDFSVKDIKMGVENITNGNSIIQAAMNLFINSNGQELLKEMKPALKTELTLHLKRFMNKLFTEIPVEQWYD